MPCRMHCIGTLKLCMDASCLSASWPSAAASQEPASLSLVKPCLHASMSTACNKLSSAGSLCKLLQERAQ